MILHAQKKKKENKNPTNMQELNPPYTTMDSSGATNRRIRGIDPLHTVRHAGGPWIDCKV